MIDDPLELAFLRQAVERKSAGRIASSADFVRLSEEMEDRVSPSTLKRLWGYVSMKVKPRRATLDALSRYAGFRDYAAFAEDLRSSVMVSSLYFNAARIDAASLQRGDTLQIGWRPDRIVTLRYLGDGRFRVEESVHSKLEAGDEFVLSSIVKGFPLIIPEIERGGEKTSSFIAGRDGGIVIVRTL